MREIRNRHITHGIIFFLQQWAERRNEKEAHGSGSWTAVAALTALQIGFDRPFVTLRADILIHRRIGSVCRKECFLTSSLQVRDIARSFANGEA